MSKISNETNKALEDLKPEVIEEVVEPVEPVEPEAIKEGVEGVEGVKVVDTVDLKQLKVLFENGVISEAIFKNAQAEIEKKKASGEIKVKGTRDKAYNPMMVKFCLRLSSLCKSFADENENHGVKLETRKDGSYKLNLGVDRKGNRRAWDGYVFPNLDK